MAYFKFYKAIYLQKHKNKSTQVCFEHILP